MKQIIKADNGSIIATNQSNVDTYSKVDVRKAQQQSFFFGLIMGIISSLIAAFIYDKLK